jgi:hypothetical protein
MTRCDAFSPSFQLEILSLSLTRAFPPWPRDSNLAPFPSEFPEPLQEVIVEIGFSWLFKELEEPIFLSLFRDSNLLSWLSW